MNRKEFLKLTTIASVGSPFLINGMTSQALNNFTDLSITCDSINDRVLVIVRLAGANDGLNTIIPINQYDTYAALRPDIRISNIGNNKFINLDTNLPNNMLSGLHPLLTGFKDLYDRGKLSVINGVGYPQPNLSHFKSENTLFAGKDGTNNQLLDSGIFGRFLSYTNPGLAGRPTTESPDPLAIQFGSTNPSLFYGHKHEIGVEYNLTNFQNEFFKKLSLKSVPSQYSEHIELIKYLNTVEGAMDIYYDRTQEVFNKGINSNTSYPNSDLSKQLKTVARMIKGGSKTKIFQVNLNGFDTHVNQVLYGQPHLGRHSNLISTISDGINAFQKDIESLGIADKILTVTFSEFGRQVRQNGNLGTDHGTLSPFFVIGNSVKPGVFGSHPIFSNRTEFQYNENQIKYDYRQIFATLIQDWLGASDTAMNEIKLSEFSTQTKKIPIINENSNAYPNCLISFSECNNSFKAVKIFEDENWSYYGENGKNIILFAVEHTPNGIDANTSEFSLEVTITKNCYPFPYNNYSKKQFETGEGLFFIGEYWNTKITSGEMNGWINIKWFTEKKNEEELGLLAKDFQIDKESTYISPIIHIIVNEDLKIPNDIRDDVLGLNKNFKPILNLEYNSYNNQEYTQYNKIQFSQETAGGKLIKITNKKVSDFPTNQQKKGIIRYNSNTHKIEGFDGIKWNSFN